MLAGYNNAFGVYHNHRSFHFPAVELPKKEKPKERGDFRGRRGPEPVRPVPVAAVGHAADILLDRRILEPLCVSNTLSTAVFASILSDDGVQIDLNMSSTPAMFSHAMIKIGAASPTLRVAA